jgi:tetratricopeptide (TPR) repeat protein
MNTEKAKTLRYEAETLFNAKPFFEFNKNDRLEKAHDLFKQAGNIYKNLQHYELGAKCYLKALKSIPDPNMDYEKVQLYHSVALCYEKCGHYDKSISI